MAPKKADTDSRWVFLGTRLRELRKDEGFKSAEALATRIQNHPECSGVIKETVLRWERGDLRPNLSQALALEVIFRVPVRKWYEQVQVESRPLNESPSTSTPNPKPAPKKRAETDGMKQLRTLYSSSEEALAVLKSPKSTRKEKVEVLAWFDANNYPAPKNWQDYLM